MRERCLGRRLCWRDASHDQITKTVDRLTGRDGAAANTIAMVAVIAIKGSPIGRDTVRENCSKMAMAQCGIRKMDRMHWREPV